MTDAIVLIVDDSATVRSQVKDALKSTGLSILEAKDGLEAIEAIKATPTVRLMFLDINMPRMNGVETLEKINEDGLGDSLAIVVLTTEGHPELVKRAKEAGAKGWMVKPFNPDQLAAVAKKLTQS